MKKYDSFEVQLDNRIMRQNRGFAISGIYDALVEIITNCDDSYKRLHSKQQSRDSGDILITVTRRRQGQPSLVSVADKAEGLSRKDMEEKLVHVGRRTSESGDRGFMGRGIKDCTELGNVTVESIQNGKYCECKMYEDLEKGVDISRPISADTALRKKLGIKKNGTVVTIATNEKVPQIGTLVKDLSLNFALREILTSGTGCRVRIRGSDGKLESIHSSSKLYSGTPNYDEKIEIDGYPKAECRLTIWKHTKKLIYKQPKLRESGILIKGRRAIYECTLFGYEHAGEYCGKLECPFIDRLLEQFDTANKGTLIIDPARNTGLNKNHPFAKKLIEKIETILGELLEKDKKQTQQPADIASEETKKRLNKLAQAANRLWNKEFETAGDDATELALDKASTDGFYILPPRFTLPIGRKKSLTVYVNKSNYSPNRQVRMNSSDTQVLSIEGIKNLKRHQSKDDIFYGSFKVEAKKLGEAVVTVSPKKAVTVQSFGKVVKKGAPGEDIHVFASNKLIEFERARYQIVEGKNKALKIFVKSSGKNHHTVSTASTSKPDYVVVVGGHKCSLTPTTHGYAVGEVNVKGVSVTENNKPAIITAKVGHQSAKTTVRVVEKKISASRFNFELTNEELGPFRARWADLEGRPNLLKISATHPSINHYFGEPLLFSEQNTREARALIAELITENFCVKILEEKMKHQSGGGYKFTNKKPDEILIEVFVELQREISEFSITAHKIMIK